MIKKYLRIFEVNRAILYSLAAKIWSFISGPVVIIVLSRWLSPEQQGYYYTFASVLLMQMFFEFGLGIVLVQTASHEWAFLQLNCQYEIIGNKSSLSRLSSLLRFSVSWYSISAIVLVILLGCGGFIYFSGSPAHEIEWKIPWILLVVFTGMSLPLIPLVSILEGCGQVEYIYKFRLIQGIVNTIVIVLCVIIGAELYTLVISAIFRLLIHITFLLYRYKSFFLELLKFDVIENISWRTEIWPFQWRVGVSSFAGYLMNLLFTPVIFHYHGAILAGQMGMSLSLVGVASSIGYTWVQARVPQFGSMIARKEVEQLKVIFIRLASIAVIVTGVCSFSIWLFVFWLKSSGYEFAARILPLWPLTALLMAELFKVVSIVIVLYLRSFKKEPLMFVSILSSIFSSIVVVISGKYYGPFGATAGYLFVTMFISFPLSLFVYVRFNKSISRQICSNPRSLF